MNTIWVPDLTQFPGPKFLSLTRALRDAIQQGNLEPGMKLPPVRDLAFHLGITPGTVARAYQVATQEGLLSATVGRGTFVAAAKQRLGPTQPLMMDRIRVTSDGPVDLRAPVLPDVGQSAIFADVFSTISQEMQGDWLDYARAREDLPLRNLLCNWMEDRLLGPLGPEDIAVTQGGQHAVLSVLLCCLRGDRPVVLIEELAYSGFRHAARLARAEVVGIEMDAEGILPHALEAACRRHGPQVLCLTVEAQNPTGARMGAERRAQIAAIARKFDLQVIEDDCYSASVNELPSMRAMAPERTWFVSSWSKTISASLRFGFIICPTAMGQAGRLTVQHSLYFMPRPLTELAYHLLSSGAAADIRRAVQAELAERSQVMVNHLGTQDLGWQKGLPFVWVRLPSGWRASTFAREAEAAGVLVRSADEYALIHGRAPHAVRLAVNGMIPRERLEVAVDRLAALLHSPPGDLCV